MPVLFSYISLLRKLYQYTTNGMVSILGLEIVVLHMSLGQHDPCLMLD